MELQKSIGMDTERISDKVNLLTQKNELDKNISDKCFLVCF